MKQYEYNGKELNEELGLNRYDYGARNYQADLGRWFNVDPLAEKYFNVSSYNYCLNNPINMIDPDGRFPDWVERNGQIVFDKDVISEATQKLGDKYLGSEGYDLQNYYLSNGKKAEFPGFMLGEVTVRPDPVAQIRRSVNNAINEVGSKVALGSLAVPATAVAMVYGGEFLLSSGIISTELWLPKAVVSTTSQAVVNKGEVNLVGVAGDAFTGTGWGGMALNSGVSSMFEAKYNIFDNSFKTSSVFGDKPVGETSLQFGTGMFFGTKLKLINSQVPGTVPQLMLSIPNSLAEQGINRGVSDAINKKRRK